jgi:AGZA family xanthine/uracil permease-like MFS transporter
VVLACVPALAYLALLNLNQLLAPGPEAFAGLRPDVQHWVQTVTTLAGGGGFIVTSLLWATALAKLIDGRMNAAALTLGLAALASLFGVIHSPLPSSPILPPGAVQIELAAAGRLGAAAGQTPAYWAAAYAATALCWLLLGRLGTPPSPTEPRPPTAV